MSLILDALRKSEAERRRGQTPGLFTPTPTQTAPAQRRPSAWPWLIAATLIVAVILAWWFRPMPLPARIVVAPASPAPVVAPVSTAITPAPMIVAPATIASMARAPSSTTSVREIATPPPLPLATPPAIPAAVAADVPVLDLPTLAMLDPSERAALPPLKLSMHVWAESPSARMAIIDGQRVTEGSTIGSSVVAEIRRDGVVLDLHGRRFLLPRP